MRRFALLGVLVGCDVEERYCSTLAEGPETWVGAYSRSEGGDAVRVQLVAHQTLDDITYGRPVVAWGDLLDDEEVPLMVEFSLCGTPERLGDFVLADGGATSALDLAAERPDESATTRIVASSARPARPQKVVFDVEPR